MRLPSAEWLPLFQQLTQVSDAWGVWKNAERALQGLGDVDSAAPTSEQDLLANEFRQWASEQELRWVVECRHAGGMVALIALDDAVWAQLDLMAETPFRGTRLFTADQLRPLMVMDPRGFRQVRGGAEGVFLFLQKGLRRGGRANVDNLRKYGVLEKVAEDWEGAQTAAALLGAARRPLVSALASAIEGHWDRSTLLRAEAITVLRSIKDPAMLMSRAYARWWALRRCVVATTIYTGRRPEPVPRWLDRVREDHTVHTI